MVEVWLALTASAGVLLLGFLARLGFDRWRLPDFLILVALGVAVGPAGWSLLPAEAVAGIHEAAPGFLALTVAFLMMEAGVQISLRSRRIDAALIVLHTAAACGVTFVGSWALVFAWGFSSASATVLAAATLGPSAVVLSSFASRIRLKDRTKAALLFEGIIANVLSFFVILSVPGLTGGPAGPAEWAGAVSALALAILVAAGAAVAWAFVLRMLHPKEGIFIATMAVAIAVYAVSSGPLGGNGAIAAFAFGAILRKAGGITMDSGADQDHEASAAHLGRFHGEISFLVRTYFFLYLGLQFVPGAVTSSGVLLVGVLVAVFVLSRLPSCIAMGRLWHLPRSDMWVLGGSVSRGLTDVLVVLFAVSAGIVPAAEASALTNVMVLLLIASLVANGVALAVSKRLASVEGRSAAEQGSTDTPPSAHADPPGKPF